MTDAQMLPFILGGFGLWAFFLLLDYGLAAYHYLQRRHNNAK